MSRRDRIVIGWGGDGNVTGVERAAGRSAAGAAGGLARRGAPQVRSRAPTAARSFRRPAHVAIVVGTALPTGDWTNVAGACTRILVVTHDAPCEVLDRVRELSGEGRVRVLPCYADASLRAASALAAASLDDVAALAH